MNSKISTRDEVAMRDLRCLGFTQKKVSEMFDVSKQTVCYHTNPKYHEEQLERCRNYKKNRK